MRESSKSLRRRWVEHETGVFPWRDLFQGYGLDVGAGTYAGSVEADPLPFENCQPWDRDDGDANDLSRHFAKDRWGENTGSFNYVHASQVLEHMRDAEACLRDWLTLLTAGGHLIVTVPDFDLYEKRRFPSAWNADHKAVFSTWRKGFPGIAAPFIHVPTMLAKLDAEVRLCRLVATNYNWTASEDVDQSFREEAGVECWVEFCLRKL